MKVYPLLNIVLLDKVNIMESMITGKQETVEEQKFEVSKIKEEQKSSTQKTIMEEKTVSTKIEAKAVSRNIILSKYKKSVSSKKGA